MTQVQVQSDVYLSKSTEVLVFNSTWVSRVHFLNIALLQCLHLHTELYMKLWKMLMLLP